MGKDHGESSGDSKIKVNVAITLLITRDLIGYPSKMVQGNDSGPIMALYHQRC